MPRNAPRILVTRQLALDPREVLEPLLGPEGEAFLLDAWARESPMPREELLARVAKAEALVCSPADPIDAELLAHAPSLRVVANHAVGLDNLNLAVLEARGIPATHTPGVLTDATADLALALLLSLARRLPEGERMIHEGRFHGWSPRMLLGLELRGACLGIFGFGRIGQAVAARASAFGMGIYYCARRDGPSEVVMPIGARRVPFDELLEKSDVISLHCPLTEETRHAINAATIAQMRRGALLINTARGPVLDEEAAADALESGHLGGIALDVHEHEPQINARLLAHPRALLLPHLGSATISTREAMARLALTDAARVLLGKKPLHPAPRYSK